MKYHWEAYKLREYLNNLIQEADKVLYAKQEKRTEARKELDSLVATNQEIFNDWWHNLEKDGSGYPLNVSRHIGSLRESLVSATAHFDTEVEHVRGVFVPIGMAQFYDRYKRVCKEQLSPEVSDFFTTKREYIIVEVKHPCFSEWVELNSQIDYYTSARNRLADSKEGIRLASSVTLSDRDVEDIKILQELL